MSVTFRDFSNNSTNKHQWIVLDGDIDAGALLGAGREDVCKHIGLAAEAARSVPAGRLHPRTPLADPYTPVPLPQTMCAACHPDQSGSRA